MKKTILLILCILTVFVFASCGDDKTSLEIQIETSFDDKELWKPSSLARAGLEHLPEPEGITEFTVNENGNVSFTKSGSDKETLYLLGDSIYSKISHHTDDINPKNSKDAVVSDTYFKTVYSIDGKTVTVELKLEGENLKAFIIYS